MSHSIHVVLQRKLDFLSKEKKGLISGVSVSEVCRRNGIHSSQYYSWQRKFLEGAEEGLKQKGRRRNGDNEKESKF